jgi:hypothetical protein
LTTMFTGISDSTSFMFKSFTQDSMNAIVNLPRDLLFCLILGLGSQSSYNRRLKFLFHHSFVLGRRPVFSLRCSTMLRNRRFPMYSRTSWRFNEVISDKLAALRGACVGGEDATASVRRAILIVTYVADDTRTYYF